MANKNKKTLKSKETQEYMDFYALTRVNRSLPSQSVSQDGKETSRQ